MKFDGITPSDCMSKLLTDGRLQNITLSPWCMKPIVRIRLSINDFNRCKEMTLTAFPPRVDIIPVPYEISWLLPPNQKCFLVFHIPQ